MKKTKRALLLSAIAVVMSIAMLIGSTFAWFTDSASTAVNTIQSGTLKVALEMFDVEQNKWVDAEGKSLEWVTTDEVDNVLWEPNCTYELPLIRVRNDGNLALKYEISVLGAKGDLELLDVIDFTASIDGAAEVALDTFTGHLDAKDASSEILIKGHMDKNAGNEYQGLTVDNIAIIVYATQYTYESDSFGPNYDADAPFSMWDGTVPTEMPKSLVVDVETQTVHVKDAAAFAYLSTLSSNWRDLYTDGNGATYTNYVNGAGGKYYYSGQWTVSLEADIDLGNYPINPVEIVIGENCGYSTFNGNNHTIRNIKATTGLFADGNRASYSNLKLLNVTATRGALAGSPRSSITNVTVKNAFISGENYVGGLVGSAYSSVTNCKVEDSSIIATGKEAGGLVGYIETSASGTPAEVKNNTVRNVSVYAGERAAGLVAQVNTRVKVYNNTINTVTVGAADTSKYAADAVISNRITDSKNVYNNTVTNANIISVKFANNADELKAALDAGEKNIVLKAGTYTFPASSFKAGTTLICEEGTVFTGSSKLNINGATVVGASFSNPSGTLATGIVNGTFKDCDFVGGWGAISVGRAGETVVFENCNFDGSTYGVHFDNGANDVVFKNCTLSGFNTFGAELTKLTFDGCTFKASGRSKYNGVNLWGNTDLIDCTFVFDGTASTEWVDLSNSNKTVTFTNCVVTDGKTQKGVETVVGNFKTGNTVIVDGKPVVFFNDDLKAAVANGDTDILLRNGEYDLNGIVKDGLTLTGIGDNVKVANTTRFASGNAVGAITKAINLKNVTITNTVYTMENGSNATFTNVNFAAGFRQGYGKNVKFTDCTFGSNSDGYALHFQTDSASEGGLIKLNGCEFKGGNVHLGGKRAYEFTGCDFAEGTDFQVWSDITLDGCTVNGVEVTATNVANLFPNLNLEKVTIK